MQTLRSTTPNDHTIIMPVPRYISRVLHSCERGMVKQVVEQVSISHFPRKILKSRISEMVFPASWGKIKTFMELKRLNCSNKNFHNKNPTKNRSSSIGFLGHFYIHNGIDNSILYTTFTTNLGLSQALIRIVETGSTHVIAPWTHSG